MTEERAACASARLTQTRTMLRGAAADHAPLVDLRLDGDDLLVLLRYRRRPDVYGVRFPLFDDDRYWRQREGAMNFARDVWMELMERSIRGASIGRYG